jgi:hypothetical protein
MTMGSHQTPIGKSQVHLTPRWILDPLGKFDLDPCASDPRPWEASTGEFQPTAGNIKVMLAALHKIAADGDEDAADIATTALETIGVLKKTNGASAAGHRVAAE